jgi:hypothetical protein
MYGLAINFDLTTAIRCRLTRARTGDAAAVNARSGFTAAASLYTSCLAAAEHVYFGCGA